MTDCSNQSNPFLCRECGSLDTKTNPIVQCDCCKKMLHPSCAGFQEEIPQEILSSFFWYFKCNSCVRKINLEFMQGQTISTVSSESNFINDKYLNCLMSLESKFDEKFNNLESKINLVLHKNGGSQISRNFVEDDKGSSVVSSQNLSAFSRNDLLRKKETRGNDIYYKHEFLKEKCVKCLKCNMWLEVDESNFKTFAQDKKDFKCIKCLETEIIKTKLKFFESLLQETDILRNKIETLEKQIFLEDNKRGDKCILKDSGINNSEFTIPKVLHKKEINATSKNTEDSKISKLIVMGDSIIRDAGDMICNLDRQNRVRVCLPGARVKDVIENIDSIKKTDGILVVHVGTNDLGNRTSELLAQDYDHLINKCKEKGVTLKISGILPRYDSRDKMNRALSMNFRLERMCQNKGVQYIHVWESFIGKRIFFSGDGIHLNKVGARTLADIWINTVLTGN